MMLLMIFNPSELRSGCLRILIQGDKRIWAHEGFVATDTDYTFVSCDNMISSHSCTSQRLNSTFYGADRQFPNLAFPWVKDDPWLPS